MGKRIISQARGKGSLTYRVRKKAFQHKVKYPMHEGEAEVVNLVHSAAHSAPLLKIQVSGESFFNSAFDGAFVGQKILVGGEKVDTGNIVCLRHIPTATRIFNIERNPGDGGKMIRTAGSSAIVFKKYDNKKVGIMMPNKKEVILSHECRATVGIIGGGGKKQKPLFKAGAQFYKKRAKGKLWPRVSAVATNAVDHPFGSGRGKHVKSKTIKRNASPGQKVGHLRPRKTGKKR